MKIKVQDGEVDLSAVLEKMKGQQGGSDQVALKLLSDNYKARQKIKDLETENTDLKTKVPQEGSRILTKDEAAAFEAMQKLGSPAEVGQKLAKFDELQTEVSKTARKTANAKAAKVAKFDPDALEPLLSSIPGASLEVKTEKRDGKDVEVAYVKDGDTTKPLADYAAEKWPKLLPSLKEQAAGSNGTPWPQQNGGGKAPETNAGKAYVNKAYAEPAKK